MFIRKKITDFLIVLKFYHLQKISIEEYLKNTKKQKHKDKYIKVKIKRLIFKKILLLIQRKQLYNFLQIKIKL